MTSNRAVGIDFGTTTSLVAEGTAGRQPLVYPIGRSTTWLPSLVGLDGAGDLLVGDDADALPAEAIKRSIKRCITLGESEVVLGNGAVLDADRAITAVLSAVARQARSGIDLTPEATRLGCPAMWTGQQRQRLLDLAEKSGLPVTDHTLVDEPVAAGVAWVKHQLTQTRRRVKGKLLVFDMGGGTLDVALLDVHAEFGEDPEISVLSSWGEDEAGDSLDRAIASDLVEQVRAAGIGPDDLPDDSLLLQQAATEAKIQLTSARDTVVAVRGASAPVPALAYSRERLEIAFSGQLQRAENLVWSVLRGSRVTHQQQRSPMAIRALSHDDLRKEVDIVLLAGGMSRVPAVARLMDRMFPGAELHTHAGVAADEAIVAGLAETTAYKRINLHRPPFDFVLEYVDNGAVIRIPVYDAYAPFYPPSHAMTRNILHHEWRASPGSVPRRGTGYLRIYTAAGESVRLDLEGNQGAVELRFGHHPPAVLIHPNGRVLIVDGRQVNTSFTVPRWPVIRGKDHATLYAARELANLAPVITKPWDNDPLFLH